MFELLDTLPAFLATRGTSRHLNVEQQIDRWAAEYLRPWPELREVQIEDYRLQGLDWREIARTRIFPDLEQWHADMVLARDHLLNVLPEVVERIAAIHSFPGGLLCVIHVGLGCGAGWATQLHGRPAVLFGLENIAGCGWTSREALMGLVAHELGHLLLDQWRQEAGLAAGQGPIWQLFEEGFAQRVALEYTGTWHMVHGQEHLDWLSWCKGRLPDLANRYLELVKRRYPLSEFFGSWLEIDGRSQAGIYLGVEVIHKLAYSPNLKDIAAVTDIEAACLKALRQLANDV